jgi:TRAP-type C4-dicarboxylate transport system permease small subunit
MLQQLQIDHLLVETRTDRLARFAAVIDACCHFLSVSALVVLIAVVAAEVLLRSMFATSLGFADEISGYLLVALCFIGLSVTYGNDGFHRIELAKSKRRKAVFRFLADVVAFVFAAVLVWQFWRVELQAFRLDSLSPTVLRTPLWIPMIPMLLGATMFLLRIAIGIALSLQTIFGRAPSTSR